MNQKIIHYIKLFFTILIVFFISSFMINGIFLAGSPRINPYTWNNIISKIGNFKNNFFATKQSNLNQIIPQKNINQQTKSITEEFFKNNLKIITKGVSAATKDNYSYSEFKINEIEWVTISYTLKDGQVVNVQYPKGTNPPLKEIYENP